MQENEIERARRAILEAPATDSGLIIPPHVRDQVERARQAAAQPPAPTPNRAQRRAAKRAQRKRGKQ